MQPTENQEKHFKFIDLFSGLGGFHMGLSRLGHHCVFASELDANLRELYEVNFGMRPAGDIRTVKESEVPEHDLLCAGFPCQPFSRAGKKKGAECPESGKLIDDVLRIVREKNPKYIMLENVPDILTIQDGKFWDYICKNIIEAGYEIDYKIYTPNDFGIPQKRKRIFVVASKIGLEHFSWPVPEIKKSGIESIIINSSQDKRPLELEKEKVLDLWNDFIGKVKTFTSLPILSPEFGATYPYNRRIEKIEEAQHYNGKFGESMSHCRSWSDVIVCLPRYAQEQYGKTNPRVSEAIEFSRELYLNHQEFLDSWKINLIDLPHSWQKLEWQGDRMQPDIWKHLIQFRASGIRIIRPTTAPSLVAMSTTQTPIIGFLKRYMSIREAAALQSLDALKNLPQNNSKAYRALGNAVNAHVVKEIATRLVQ